MDLYAPIVRYMVYPLWLLKNKSDQANYLRGLKRTQYLSRSQLEKRQWNSIRSLLDYAYRHCPFYYERFREIGKEPRDIQTREDFLQMPLLSRENVQQHMNEILSDNLERTRLLADKTGGSTGAPIMFRYTKKRLEFRQACAERHDEWAGYRMGDKKALLWGAARDIAPLQRKKAKVRNLLLDRTLLLDASAITEERMCEFAEALRKFRPKVILAYANVATLFAKFLLRNGMSIPAPRSVITSAELLTNDARKLIEKAFRCKVYNRYGCREFAVIASECGQAQGMHIAAESLYVEVLADDGTPVSPGQRGKIVVTDLQNLAMPFIRYEIGDSGRMVEGECPCGRGLPRIELAEGRTTEFLVDTRGELVSGVVLATYAITQIEGIERIQIVQETPAEVWVRILKGPLFTDAAEAQLRAKMQSILGLDMKVHFSYVREIPVSSSGKCRFIMSNAVI